VARHLQRVAHGRPDAHQRDLAWRRLESLDTVDAQPGLLGGALDQWRVRRAARFQEQQVDTTCCSWKNTLVARWRPVFGYVAR